MAKVELNDLQMDFLRAFFSRENSYFLTGGAALVGFYFGHRETNDLDLFTLDDSVESGFAILNDVARQLGSNVEPIQTSPDFRRVLVTRGDEAIIVDLVREYVFQITPEKDEINGIRIDSPKEILANKLCALLSRSEIRDLVDVMVLEKAGFDLEVAIEAAAKKDAGLSPAQLAWVLHQIEFGADLTPPGDVPVAELRLYLDGLIERLQKLALPK